MFAGRVGAALVIGRAEKSVNVGIFALVALLLDALFWLFVLAGWESVAIPTNFAGTHQPEFVFPYHERCLSPKAGYAAYGNISISSAKSRSRQAAFRLPSSALFNSQS